MLLRIYDGQCAFFSFRMSEVLQKKATNECKIEGDLVGTYFHTIRLLGNEQCTARRFHLQRPSFAVHLRFPRPICLSIATATFRSL